MGTMFDFILYGLSLVLFSIGVWLMLRRGFAYYAAPCIEGRRVTWRCNKYANHATYVLTVGDAVIRWTYIYPKRPSDNSSSPGRARC
jgi:hypothetical protein